MTFPYDNRHLGLDYSGFFKCYLRQSLPQHVTMVKTDVRDHAEDGIDHIRAVKTSSESGLKHHYINLAVCEPVHGHKRCYLKERKVQMVECISPFHYKIPNVFLRDIAQSSVIDAHALTEIKDMWRSIKPYLPS